MKKKTCKIIICICLFLVLFTSFTNVFGRTNPNYIPKDTVSENVLDQKVKDSVLLDALANMINAFASLIEYLVGSLFQSLTGDNIFPWADRIIFNGIGFLDINFLNPADNSLFMQDSGASISILGEVIQKVYSTIFSLAVLFLGVAVGIMAIRLAISTIASEKARYKQAIVSWATCIVMLFMMHYILAFVFWVNEEMVEIASSILTDTIEEKGLNKVDFNDALNTILKPEDRVDNFFDAVGTTNFADTDTDNLKAEPEVTSYFLTNEEYIKKRMYYYTDTRSSADVVGDIGAWLSQSDQDAKIGALRLSADVAAARQLMYKIETDESSVTDSIKENGYYDPGSSSRIWRNRSKYLDSKDYTEDLKTTAKYLYLAKNDVDALSIEMQTYPERKIAVNVDHIGWKTGAEVFTQGGFGLVMDLIKTSYESGKINSMEKQQLIEELGSSVASTVATYRLQCDEYIWNAGNGDYDVSGETTDLIASLGEFFKKSAYVYTTETSDDGQEEITGWRASKVTVTGALIYAVFIFQSLIYLVSYVKRVFYVIMLSMFGPIVVIYDFFMKSTS